MISLKSCILVILLLSIGCREKRIQHAEAVRNKFSCYSYTDNRDTIRLQVITRNDSVTGELTFDFFEKDDNNGTIKGIVRGDTLFADYTFLSEGILSKREVAFVMRGSSLVELFGETTERDDKIVFVNPAALRVGDDIILDAVTCE